MLSLYIIAAIVGVALVIVASVSGFGDSSEYDASVDHEVHAVPETLYEHSGSFFSEIWLPILTLRFWIYFAASFGLIGFILEVFKVAIGVESLLWALAGGCITGYLVALALRLIRRGELHSGLAVPNLLGTVGRVLVPVGKEKMGKVRVIVQGESVDFLAFADKDQKIDAGEEVVILYLEKSIARVARKIDVLEP